MFETFQSSFMQAGLIASGLIGISCGYLSVYVVLKRLVFLAVALAQLASAAVALSLFFNWNPVIAAFIGVLIGALFFSWPGIGRYLPRENAIGSVYALASAAGVLLIAKNASGEDHLLNLMYGNVLTVTVPELWLMGGVVLATGTLYLCFAKELIFTSFDPEMAQTVGVRPRLWELLFNISLGLVIAMAIRLGGMMLVFTLLVLPGYAALLARCRIGPAFIWAMAMAVVTGAVGLYLSFIWDLPTSAVVMAGLGVCVLCGAVIGAIRSRLPQRPAPVACTGRIANAGGKRLLEEDR